MTFDWRAQPLAHMSLMQLEALADEGNADAKAALAALDLKRAMSRPTAERRDNYGRVKTTGAW
jgi:hypothetical protein